MGTVITFRVGDEAHDFDLATLLISEAREMKRCIGISTISELMSGIDGSDPDCIAFTWWLARKRGGAPAAGPFIDFDFDMAAFDFTITAPGDDDAAPEEGADPDLPTSSGPPGGEPAGT